MKRKRRTEISVETNQVLVIRRHRKKVQAWRPECAELVLMATVDEAATIAGVNARTIYRWVEDGKLHFTETRAGLLLICLSSLS